MLLFGKERMQIKENYGNEWVLCVVINGKLEILKSSKDRGELEDFGFTLDGNILFDVLHPNITSNYNYKRVNKDSIL